MVALLDISAELLEPILAYLSISTTSTLSRTYKPLHLYLSPRIYHTIDWFWQVDRPAPPFHLLLRTLTLNHRLAELIKTIRLRGTGIIPPSEWDRAGCELNNRSYSFDKHSEKALSIIAAGSRVRSSFLPLEQWCIHSIIIGMKPTLARKWWIEFDRGNVDAIVSLILHQCQALEELDLGFGYMYYAQYLPLVFRRLLDRPKAFALYPQLGRVNLGIDGPISPKGVELDIDLFRFFLTLPRLAYLNTMVLEPSMFTWPSPSIPLHSTSLTALILHESTASERTLATILQATPNLKHLEYDFRRLVSCGDWNCFRDLVVDDLHEATEADFPFSRPDAAIRAPLLSKALVPVHQVLQSLVIKILFECDIWMEGVCNIKEWGVAQRQCHLIGRIKNLKNMHKLRDLEISWALLFGWWDSNLDEIIDHRKRRRRVPVHPEMGDPCATILHSSPWTGILPPNIERVCLRDDLGYHDNYPHDTLNPFVLAEQLLEARKWHYPALKQIDFFFSTAD